MSNVIDLDGIVDTLYSWISSRALYDNQKIYIEKLNQIRPTPPSISYDMLTLPQKIGTRDDTSYSGVGDVMTISGPRTFTVTFKTYGEGAGQNLSNLYESIELHSVQQLFQAANLAVHGSQAPQDISQEVETGIEERFNMDIIFGITSIQSEDQGAVETINIVDAKVKDVTGATVQTINEQIQKP